MPPSRFNQGLRSSAKGALAAEAAPYTTGLVAKLSGLTPAQVRSLCKAHCVGRRVGHRRGQLAFAFQDLSVLRLAARLLRQGLPFARVRRLLCRAHAWATARKVPLSALQLSVHARQVQATDGQTVWDAETGQSLGPATGATRRPIRLPRRTPDSLTPWDRFLHPFAPEGRLAGPPNAFVPDHGPLAQADLWFGRGLLAERTAPAKACGYYLQAISCNPEHVEAMINLGHLCAAQKERDRAAAFFRLATRIDPGHAVAYFNLAVILHDKGERGAAMQAYRKALLIDGHFADAHYNLASLLAEQGHHAEAGRHLLASRASRGAKDGENSP